MSDLLTGIRMVDRKKNEREKTKNTNNEMQKGKMSHLIYWCVCFNVLVLQPVANIGARCLRDKNRGMPNLKSEVSYRKK
jgi:hypothetical protein